MASNRGLGRGLESLIPTDVITSQINAKANQQQVQKIAINAVHPNPHQPRVHFDEQAIKELAASLKNHGLMQPIVVTKQGNNSYQLVAGERRLRAAKHLGWDSIDALVRTIDEQSKLELALIENTQRDDLSPLEVAAAYVKLIELFGMSFEDLSKRTGRADSTLRNTIRLLGLPPEAKKALTEGHISEGHARQILAVASPQKQRQLLQLMIDEKWTVRQTEQFTKKYKQEGAEKRQAVKRVKRETPLTKRLSKRLERPVWVKNMAKSGRLVIEFKDEADLKDIVSRLGS